MNDVASSRADANLRAMLEPDVPVGLEELLGRVRPFTAATLALMQRTKNEWLKRLPPEQMDGHYFATLAWLYIQVAPEAEVRRTAFVEALFREAVLQWGAAVTPAQLAGADAIIQHSLTLVDHAQVSIAAKPVDSDAKAPPDPPPNC